MSDFEDRYAALCRAYAARLPARLAELRGQIEAARATPGVDALATARDAAHKLHGTAGSYGFAEVTAAFGALERAIDDLAARRAPDARDWSGLEDAMRTCEGAVERVSADRTS